MKKLFITLSILLSGIVVAAPAVVSAQLFQSSRDQACKGIALDDSANCGNTAQAASRANGLIKAGINIFSAIIGIIAVVMIMIGGLKYMTSQGDAAAVNSAKNTILYAAVGIVVALLAQVIARFVVARFTG